MSTLNSYFNDNFSWTRLFLKQHLLTTDEIRLFDLKEFSNTRFRFWLSLSLNQKIGRLSLVSCLTYVYIYTYILRENLLVDKRGWRRAGDEITKCELQWESVFYTQRWNFDDYDSANYWPSLWTTPLRLAFTVRRLLLFSAHFEALLVLLVELSSWNLVWILFVQNNGFWCFFVTNSHAYTNSVTKGQFLENFVSRLC